MNDFDNIAHFENIVLLIDADNTSYTRIQDVMREISTRGRIVVKRAYGNWKKEALKNWEEETKKLAIKPVQVFDYVTGKNATDMALVIDAIHLLNNNMYDAFVIVSSDSDYTPLAIDLHESGVYVIGIGEQKKSTDAFRNSCDEFVFIENLVTPVPDSGGKPSPNETVSEKDDPDSSVAEIHNLIKIAYDTYQDDDGLTNIGYAGHYIKRAKPDFDVRTYGFKKLSKFMEAFPEKYALVKYPTSGGTSAIYYRCK